MASSAHGCIEESFASHLIEVALREGYIVEPCFRHAGLGSAKGARVALDPHNFARWTNQLRHQHGHVSYTGA
jgi:hypothetical protein